MMEGWRECLLGEMADIQNGFAFKSVDFLEYPIEGSLPVIKIKNVANGDVSLNDVQHHRFDPQYAAFRVSKNDVLIALTGNHPDAETQVVGAVSMYKHVQNSLLNQRVGKFIVREGIDKSFLYYLLKNKSTHERIAATSSGSASQANISTNNIKFLKFTIPEFSIQKAIAAVLSSLDDKIDLLHRQNKTLEALAQTLFRQWFVEEADAGWVELEIGNVVTILGGTTPSTKKQEYWNGEIHWTSPRDLSNSNSLFLFDTERMITQLGLEQIGSGLMPKGTVLMSSRAPIGYLAITNIDIAINQGYIAMICDKDISNYFMYLWCKQHMEEIKNAGNGSTFEEISKSNFKSLRFVMPPETLLKQFDEIVSAQFQKILKNQAQIFTLTKLRDILLPKLMSGEVRVEV